jgi:hypothetical protein
VLIEQFVAAAVAKADFASPELDAALHARMADAYRGLVATPDGLTAFRALLGHASAHVRLWTAAQLLAHGDLAARPVLEDIASGTGLVALNAQITLGEAASGKLQPPFGRTAPIVPMPAERASAGTRVHKGPVAAQRDVCRRFRAVHHPVSNEVKAGLALVTIHHRPLNALRHRPSGDTSGWYIWGGSGPSKASDFFQPVHVGHLSDLCPEIVPYLGLPPGWRVLLAPGYEDVWFDEAIVHL